MDDRVTLGVENLDFQGPFFASEARRKIALRARYLLYFLLGNSDPKSGLVPPTVRESTREILAVFERFGWHCPPDERLPEEEFLAVFEPIYERLSQAGQILAGFPSLGHFILCVKAIQEISNIKEYARRQEEAIRHHLSNAATCQLSEGPGGKYYSARVIFPSAWPGDDSDGAEIRALQDLHQGIQVMLACSTEAARMSHQVYYLTLDHCLKALLEMVSNASTLNKSIDRLSLSPKSWTLTERDDMLLHFQYLRKNRSMDSFQAFHAMGGRAVGDKASSFATQGPRLLRVWLFNQSRDAAGRYELEPQTLLTGVLNFGLWEDTLLVAAEASKPNK